MDLADQDLNLLRLESSRQGLQNPVNKISEIQIQGLNAQYYKMRSLISRAWRLVDLSSSISDVARQRGGSAD
jgi:hypothetical protein